jgi:uncharacterized membrane protein YidH (DUF202 family)
MGPRRGGTPSASAPGQPAERTILAWNRTALASVGLAAVMVRVVSSAFPLAGAIAVSVLLGTAGAVGGMACLRRAARLRQLGTRAGALSPRIAAFVVAAAVVAGLTACAIAIVKDGMFVV